MTNVPVLGSEPAQAVEEAPSEPSDLGAAAAELIGREPCLDEPLDPVEVARMRLEIEDGVPDVTIAASLAQISSRSEQRDRWLAAFGSPVGKHLARRGGDLNAALDVLLALVPKSAS